MEQKTNAELSDIEAKEGHLNYSQETFDLIYNTLLERAENTSPQTEQIESTEQDNTIMTLGAFFSFRYMLSSKLIQCSYILGAFSVTIVSWILFMRNQLLIGLLSIIVGNLFWRLVCEIALIFYRTNEQLGLIHQELRRNSHN